MRAWILLFVVFGLLLSGCAAPAQPGAGAPPNASSANPAPNATISTSNNSEVSPMANASKDPIVVFETNRGTFKAVIYVKEAPITGSNFMKLVRSKFYDGLTFHRVESNFVIQGGDPKGDGTGGAGWNIPLEIIPGLTHQLGTLAMARSSNPNSASSQFYVVTGPASFLDGQYAVFGRVTGPNQMAVVNQIKVGDRMLKVYEQQ